MRRAVLLNINMAPSQGILFKCLKLIIWLFDRFNTSVHNVSFLFKHCVLERLLPSDTSTQASQQVSIHTQTHTQILFPLLGYPNYNLGVLIINIRMNHNYFHAKRGGGWRYILSMYKFFAFRSGGTQTLTDSGAPD